MEIFDQLKVLFTKSGPLDDINTYMITRFLSMDAQFRRVAFLANNYWVNDDIKKGIFWFFLPKYSKAPFIKYIKSKKEVESDYQDVLNALRKYYQWSDNELELYSGYYLEVFKDKDKLENVKAFMGVK